MRYNNVTGYTSFTDALPTMFVLMGNFHSRAGSRSGAAAAAVAAAAATSDGGGADFVSMRDNFDSLAALIEQFPRIRSNCCLVA